VRVGSSFDVRLEAAGFAGFGVAALAAFDALEAFGALAGLAAAGRVRVAFGFGVAALAFVGSSVGWLSAMAGSSAWGAIGSPPWARLVV
jgi:hypothetical protein